MINSETQEVLLDDELIEKDFNDALSDLQKSLESDKGTQPLQKSKGKEEEPKEEEPEEEEPEEEPEEEMYEKSISDILSEDPDASAAIDVEPFLRQLVKAIGEGMDAMSSVLNSRMTKVENMVKSQGNVLLQTAKLEKATSDLVNRIGNQPVPSPSMRVMAKSRFDNGEESKEFNNMDVLAKSRDWLKEGKINLVDAGKIELRVNKGMLGRCNDRLDATVKDLMGQEG